MDFKSGQQLIGLCETNECPISEIMLIATHQCLEDLALMSAIPGMTVVNPCDGAEMRQAVLALIDYDGPAYLRLGRMAVEYAQRHRVAICRHEIGIRNGFGTSGT